MAAGADEALHCLSGSQLFASLFSCPDKHIKIFTAFQKRQGCHEDDHDDIDT